MVFFNTCATWRTDRPLVTPLSREEEEEEEEEEEGKLTIKNMLHTLWLCCLFFCKA